MAVFPWDQAAGGDGIAARHAEEMAVAEQPRVRNELKDMKAEPLLPVERKLVGWSLAVGVVLLGLLVWLSYTFFPAQ